VSGRGGGVLVTGATGFLGGLIAAALLRETRGPLVLPHRAERAPGELIERIARLAAADGFAAGAADLARLAPVPLPATDALEQLLPALAAHGVEEVVHAAACLDYFDRAALESANVDLTRALLDVARRRGIARFVYISTAFSAGYVEGAVGETLHGEPAQGDPTDYTRTKRRAEGLVAASGLPWLILRPSVVVGSSVDGRYDGKPYGIYQLWTAGERLLTDRPSAALHFVCPPGPAHTIHQDAFVAAFLAARRRLPAGSIVNLTSREAGLPSARALYDLAMARYFRPEVVYYYEHREDVPEEALDRRQRLFLEFTATNAEIAAHPWRFETPTLDRLRAEGLDFRDATLETLGGCLDRFVARSARIQAYLARFGPTLAAAPRAVDVPGRGRAARAPA
jgi:nucleoside-diphosphate-sugar epimerase